MSRRRLPCNLQLLPIAALSIILSCLNCAYADQKAVNDPSLWGWVLPSEISDENTVVSFSVDSTWHLVEGRTSSLSGKVWQEAVGDPRSVKAEVVFPIAFFDTDNQSRDERMREILKSERFSSVILRLDSVAFGCEPVAFQAKGQCPLTLSARLSIAGVERTHTFAAILTRKSEAVEISGTTSFSWLDFGVEDPSILIAKLDPTVVVDFKLKVPARHSSEKGRMLSQYDANHVVLERLWESEVG